MIELKRNALYFSFPKVHNHAGLTIEFQRTLRIPDDGETFYLPPGLGRFPLRHVDDHAGNVPAEWIRHGGVMMPMYQSEAMWLNFNPVYVRDRDTNYPFAIKIATGKINAVSGQEWSDGLGRDPQDYVVAPGQPWLDGYCVEKGVIRQFVAMPLGAGYSAEEQVTGRGEYGGLQVIVYPMKKEVFERRFPRVEREKTTLTDLAMKIGGVSACRTGSDMGLAPGGRMRQEIYDDPFDIDDWDTRNASRCFVHIANSLVWRAITGEQPPVTPPTSKEYADAGLPWFDYYDDAATVVDGAEVLKQLKSVVEMGREKGDVPVPENESVTPERIIQIRRNLKKGQVREGEWA
jgi:hypothetical protein